MARYTFHCDIPVGLRLGPINCSQLVAAAELRLGRVRQQIEERPRVDCIAQLQWAFRSDRLIDEGAAADLVDNARLRGHLDQIREEVVAKIDSHPALVAQVGLSTLVQIIALGSDMVEAVSAAGGLDLLEFVKKELQPVDLAKLLGL